MCSRSSARSPFAEVLNGVPSERLHCLFYHKLYVKTRERNNKPSHDPSAHSLGKKNVTSVLTSADGHSDVGCMAPNPRPGGGHSAKRPVVPEQTPRVSLKHQLIWEQVSPTPPSSDFNIQTSPSHCLHDVLRNLTANHEVEKSICCFQIPHFLPFFLLSSPKISQWKRIWLFVWFYCSSL